MPASFFSILLLFFLILTLTMRLWLSVRHIRYVSSHRNCVPHGFSNKIILSAHQKAADYTILKTKFLSIKFFVNTLILVSFTWLHGLQYLSNTLLRSITISNTLYQLVFFLVFIGILGLIDLPFNYYEQFVIETRFGFNNMNFSLFVFDIFKSVIINVLISIPLLYIILILIKQFNTLWWFYTWLIWSTFQLFIVGLYPSFIAPFFNKFTPLKNYQLMNQIKSLIKRVGFKSKGLFVIDSSKRSKHGNAYFSGFGKNKCIVLFDTLIHRLTPNEIEAVIAHELGHFKLMHVFKRIVTLFFLSFILFFLLSFLKDKTWFYVSLGFNLIDFKINNDVVTLILFSFVLQVFMFPFIPFFSLISRKQEFEADAFAARYVDSKNLISALVKLYDDNAATLTPDPLYSIFYDSHPPVSVRIQKLLMV